MAARPEGGSPVAGRHVAPGQDRIAKAVAAASGPEARWALAARMVLASVLWAVLLGCVIVDRLTGLPDLPPESAAAALRSGGTPATTPSETGARDAAAAGSAQP